MNEVVRRALRTETGLLWLVSAFAVLALVLASVGVYGVTACTVSQHIHDTGVRVALEATVPRSYGLWRPHCQEAPHGAPWPMWVVDYRPKRPKIFAFQARGA